MIASHPYLLIGFAILSGVAIVWTLYWLLNRRWPKPSRSEEDWRDSLHGTGIVIQKAEGPHENRKGIVIQVSTDKTRDREARQVEGTHEK